MSLKLTSSTTPFPLSLKTHTLHSPHKVHFHVHVKYTRRERLVIRKRDEFEKFYDLHHNKGPQELKALFKVLIEKERKNAKDGGKSLGPIEFGDILGKGRSPTISLALVLSGITKEEKQEEEKPEEKKEEEKKPEENQEKTLEKDEEDAFYEKWCEEEAKKDAFYEKWCEEEAKKDEEEKRKKEEAEGLLLAAMVLGALKML